MTHPAKTLPLDSSKSGAAAAASPISLLRIRDWWQFKLTPPLALFLATLVAAGEPLLPRWLDMLALLAGIAICAAFVSLINDYCDREEDARSGKANRVAAFPVGVARTMLILVVGAGVAIAVAWRDEPAALFLYAGSWIAFAAYSAPPMRLKTRGLPGVVADALGSTMFPVLLAVVLAGPPGGTGGDALMMMVAAAAVWAFGWGMRGILYHQLGDAESDGRGLVRTFVQRRGAKAAELLSQRVALPLELIGLLALFVIVGSVVPLVFLGIYMGVVAGRAKFMGFAGKRQLVLSEYYDGLLPLAMIVASAIRWPSDWSLIIPYLLLFGLRPAWVLYHAVKLSWGIVRG